jgi:hypothetical protein
VACHGDRKPANFSSPPCSPNTEGLLRPAPTQERQIETQKPVYAVVSGLLIEFKVVVNGQNFYVYCENAFFITMKEI